MFSSCFSARDKRSLSQERWKRKAPLPAPDCPIDKCGWLALVPWEAPGPHRTMFTPMLSKKHYTWMMTQMCLQITSSKVSICTAPLICPQSSSSFSYWLHTGQGKAADSSPSWGTVRKLLLPPRVWVHVNVCPHTCANAYMCLQKTTKKIWYYTVGTDALLILLSKFYPLSFNDL